MTLGTQYEAKSDVFLLSGAEDLVPVGEPTNLDDTLVQRYRPRIEGLFARIEKHTVPANGNVFWKATTKDNTTSIYGDSKECRIADPDDKRKIFKWLLSRTFDAKGNIIVYKYKEEDGKNVEKTANERNRLEEGELRHVANKHIKKIHYGVKQGTAGEGESDFHFTLLFDYGEQNQAEPALVIDDSEVTWDARLDPFSNYKAGFEIRTYRLCKQIVMFHHFEGEDGLGSDAVPVKALQLSYDENTVATKLKEITVTGFKQLDETPPRWQSKSLPALTLEYSAATISAETKQLDASSLENLPQGIGGAYQFMDFEGEGLPGIFTEQGGGWFYKSNNGNGDFGPLKQLSEKPTPTSLGGGAPQIVDVDGDGNNELVLNSGNIDGFFSYIDGEWQNFQSFSKRLNLDINDNRIRQIDLTGDGRPDILMAEDNVFTWHESLLKEGYGEEQRCIHPLDEEEGPRVVFEEPLQTIFLADMSGGGMTDLVRIRNGEVCYWPNLGYGRFGAKVTMNSTARFDTPDGFNPQYIKLGDVDGSGTSDIFYFGNHQMQIWLNESGNSLRPMESSELPSFLPVDSATNISIVDFLGKGTSCVVWSTTKPGQPHLQMSYLDLASGGKPHLLKSIDNQMGKHVEITYAPSTKYYIEDKRSGNPWITKLPFPVHVIDSVATHDIIGDTIHHVNYCYHHGYFDGPEREFRGFGFVETIDTKEFEAYGGTSQEGYVKPILTRTWFHGGALIKQGVISNQYATEYYPGVDEENPDVLPDTVIENESALTAEEIREAYRSMKTKTLRQEVWEWDAETNERARFEPSEEDPKGEVKPPYTVAESNFIIRRIQERGENKNAVFVVYPRETITWHYEQNANDPRISHAFTLEVDDFGNITKNTDVVYPRRPVSGRIKPEQEIPYATYIENSFNDPDAGDFYLAGVPTETKQYELGNIRPEEGEAYIRFKSFFERKDEEGNPIEGLLESALSNEINFEAEMDPKREVFESRLISWQRYHYWNEAQGAPLSVGEVTGKALLHHVAAAQLTFDLVTKAFGSDISDEVLEDEAKYVKDTDNEIWWNPGLIQHYNIGDFYLPIRTEDPWGNGVEVTWDDYLMVPIETLDALDNISVADIDYRTTSPWRLTDPNNNQAEAVTDPLGMVIATSIYGQEQGEDKGDLPLVGNYEVRYEESNDPEVPPIPNRQDILDRPEYYLQSATTYFFYDLEAWKERKEPIQAVGLARETHVSEPGGDATNIQIVIAYTDGFGRELQSKLKVEPGLAWVAEEIEEGDPEYDPEETKYRYEEKHTEDRWLSSGRTVYNNKEKPVKQYEPFYVEGATYASEKIFATYGVTPIIHYDPLLRVIETDIPYKREDDGAGGVTTHHVHSKVEFTPWQIKTFDANDAILDYDYTDLYTALSDEEKAAFDKAKAHAHTPQIADLDTLGRQFLTTAVLTVDDENNPEDILETHTTFDITGQPLAVVDPRQRELNKTRSEDNKVDTFKYTYDMIGQTLRTVSIDAGDDRAFANIMGNPVNSFDSRGHKIIAEYDELHRPVSRRVEGGDVTSLDNMVEAMIYGESATSLPQPPAYYNLRGQVWRAYDPSGRTEVVSYDIKGQPLDAAKHIRSAYKTEADWTGGEAYRESLLEMEESFTTQTTYDALGRVFLQSNPDNSETRPVYHQSGKLNRLYVKLRGNTNETRFVKSITYNARGQREVIEYSDNDARPIITTYEYDDATFRLKTLVTTRVASNGTTQDAQALEYIYDPAGNVMKITDNAYDRVFTSSGPVDPVQTYTYDALYRLTEATGREHLALTERPWADTSPDAFKQSRYTALNDLGQLRNYTREYTYDESGNLTRIHHGGTNTFNRDIDIHDDSNRGIVRRDTTPIDPGEFLTAFNDNGNQIEIDHLAGLEWNYRDNISKATIIDRGEPNRDDAEYYVYDASGQRARKVKETLVSGNVVLEEKIYLGNVEIKRRRDEGSLTNVENRYTHQVMDDKERIATVHYWEAHTYSGSFAPALNQNHLRYQFGNYLGSASLELTSDGDILSYEEYFPYGGTSFMSGRNRIEVGLKEYRYTGKERDDSTGFYYYGTRYYAPWMGRWLSADPAGPVDGLNLYIFVSDNPVRKNDSTGNAEDDLVNPEIVKAGHYTGKETQDEIRAEYGEQGICYNGEAVWDADRGTWWVDRSQLIEPEAEITFEEVDVIVGGTAESPASQETTEELPPEKASGILDKVAELLRESPEAQFLYGVGLGGLAGAAPGGFVVGPAGEIYNAAGGNLPPALRAGFGIGEAAWGLAQVLAGIGGEVGGGALIGAGAAATATGAGAPLGIAGIAGGGATITISTAAILEGVADITVGLGVFMSAMGDSGGSGSGSGDGSGGSGSGEGSGGFPRETFDSFEAATGQMDDLANIEKLTTKDPKWHAHGFTQKWIGQNRYTGEWHSAFYNPSTGKFSGGKISSRTWR